LIETVINPYYSKNHKMGKKDFNENEGDLIQQGYDKKDEQEKKEAKIRKQYNIKKRSDDKEEQAEVEKDIKKKYGGFIITDEKLIKNGFSKRVALNCNGCNQYKIYPHQFLTVKGNKCGSKGNCTACMSFETARIKKYKEEYKKNNVIEEKIECPCGRMCYPNDLLKHNETLGHINGVAQLRIRGLNKVLNVKELRFLASANNLKLYYKLKASVIIDELIKLKGDVVILEEFK